MKDQGDDRRAHAVEDRGHPGQATEMDVQRAERSDDQEIWQDKRPAAGPRAPEAAAQIGDEDADLDRERAGQRLADRDGVAHLLPRQPLAILHKLLFHQADKRHRSAEPQRAEAQEIGDYLAERPALWGDRSRSLGRNHECAPLFCVMLPALAGSSCESRLDSSGTTRRGRRT